MGWQSTREWQPPQAKPQPAISGVDTTDYCHLFATRGPWQALCGMPYDEACSHEAIAMDGYVSQCPVCGKPTCMRCLRALRHMA